MIRRLIIGGLLVLGAGPALAQQVNVQSGEHSDFTRLVTRLPEGAAWRLEQDGAQARLFIDDPDVTFDTANVFRRIPRDRLDAVSQAAPGRPLILELACNCPVTSFVDDGEYVVLDIGDPVSDEPVQFGLPQVVVEVEAAEQTSPALPNVLPLLAGNAAAQLVTGGHTYGGNTAAQVAGENGASPDAPEQAETAQSEPDLSQSERVLQEQMARAATQGLVEMDPAALRNIEAQMQTPLPDSDQPVSINLRATTSVDRDMVLVNTPQALAGGSGYCLEPRKVDLAAWGDDRPFGHQVGAYRTRMAGEFDNLSTGDLSGLARTYLYFGFGAEARQLLDQIETESQDLSVLLALATLLDEGELPAPHPFDHQVHCDSVVALWSAYANPISPGDEVNSGAVLRGFVELPPHIRSHIGPGLVRRFTDAGDAETSELLLRIINRVAPHDAPPMQLAEAELARLNGEEDEADTIVEEVAHSGVKESPEALITLVNRHFDTRDPLPNDTVDLIATYVLEMRRTSLGPDLARAQALALALAGDFRAAFDAAAKLDRQKAGETLVQGLTLLTENADDLTFLEFTLAATGANPGGLPPDLTMDIARRYLGLGFPERAMALLDRPVRGAAPDDYSVLRAQAALDAGLPRRALLELVGRSGSETDALRAEALRMSGLHSEAAALFETIEAPEEAARSEWLAGLPPSGDPGEGAYETRKAASQRLVEGPPSPVDLSLAAARDLLDQAEALRRDIGLLNGGTQAGDQ